ncbi:MULTISPECIES: ABC transporter permease [unclassified Streptomyces]|uniref:ABC transporter permease n=1 Tax=unclassified Streptomyces TaxID=2593676 RepID=UPI0004E0CBD7|nr:ABC transporter permease [Streptomyces sp. NRRL F-5123]
MRTIVRRLGFYALAGFAAVTVNFFLARLLPGSALQNVLSKLRSANLDPDAMKALEAQYGAGDQSMPSQFLTYLSHLLRGDLGVSTSQSAPVSTILGNTLPWTLGLVGTATVLAFLIGTVGGIVIGWKRNGLLDSLLPATTFFQSVPYFILAFLVMMTLGFFGGLFPYQNGYDIGRDSDLTPGWNGPFVTSVVEHAALPVLTVVLASLAGWVVGMRNLMITTMDEDYVLVAAAKGLPQWRVAAVAARNALLPTIANFGLSISLVVTGSLVTEIVFTYPGVGWQIYQAILTGDFPLLQGILLVVVLTVLAVNLIADIAYVALDPRSRKEA